LCNFSVVGTISILPREGYTESYNNILASFIEVMENKQHQRPKHESKELKMGTVADSMPQC
jgi:UDP-galactopyranose mutase